MHPGALLQAVALPQLLGYYYRDVDVLVDFELGHVPGLAFFSMQGELSELLGRMIDMHTPADLSSRFRNTVVKEAEVRYD